MLTLILLYVGCRPGDFLDEPQPTNAIPAGNFFQTESDALSGINAAYAPLQNLYTENYPKSISPPADDFILDNTPDQELENFGFNAETGPIDVVWQICYEGVFRSNLVLQNVTEIQQMSDDLKNRILGEARFLRALYYWHLTSMWGDVPLVTVADPNDPSKAEVPKSPVTEVYDFMIEDLRMAADLLPLMFEGSNVGRATQGAAKALLGKIYLYSTSPLFGGRGEGFAQAEQLFKEVIDSGVYELLNNYSDLWVTDNNVETIFEVQYLDVGGNPWNNADAAGNNESNLRLRLNLPNGRGGFGNILPRQDLVDEFEDFDGETAINGRDPRLFYNIFRQGDPYDDIDPVYQSDWTPTGFTMKKGMLPIMRNDDSSSRNIPLIRFGDVLLMYAEAANANNNSEAAIDAINQVRSRVGMPELPTEEFPVSNQQEIFEAIVHERRVELAEEYQRYHDLRRWQLAEQELGPLGFQLPKHNFFPIPQDELDVNEAIEQNPNY